MAYSGETLDLTRSVESAPKPANESGGLLKAAAKFAKSKLPEMSAAPAAAKSGAANGKRTSVMSINVEMAGTITCPDELHIYGVLDGNVRASSITIGAGGSVKGEVVAETVTVFGTVDGRIHGQMVQLGAGGVVRGDIIHGALGIDPAATFEGASKRTQNPLADAPVIVAVKKPA
jgi:cytoskeletal protein CcmA (bactofilin family)